MRKGQVLFGVVFGIGIGLGILAFFNCDASAIAGDGRTLRGPGDVVEFDVTIEEMEKAFEVAAGPSVDRFWQLYGHTVGAAFHAEALTGESIDYRGLALSARTAALQAWWLGEYWPGQ